MDEISEEILVYVFFLACNFQQDKLHLSLIPDLRGLNKIVYIILEKRGCDMLERSYLFWGKTLGFEMVAQPLFRQFSNFQGEAN